MIDCNVTIDAPVSILRSGVWVPGEEGTVSYVWVVLDSFECEDFLGHWPADGDPIDDAKQLTCWGYYNRGVGRGFGGDPVLRVYGRKVLITQRCGIDV